MKTITQVIRLCLASMIFLATSSQLHALHRITGPLQAECGESVTYSTTIPQNQVSDYGWRFTYPDGTVETFGAAGIIMTLPNTRGQLSIRLVVSLFGGGQIILNYGTQIGKLPDIPEEIFGPESVCGNNTTRVYSVNPVDRAVEYRWKVSYPYFIVHPTSGDTVRTYQGTQRSVTVQFPGSGSKTRGWISAAAATGGPCAVVGGIQSLYIDFGPQTHQIEGPPSIAQNSVVAFEVNGPNLSNFIWSVPSGINILSGANTDRVVVEAPTVTSGTITATYRSCGVLRSASKQVSVTGTIGGGPGIGGFARNALTEEELGLSQVSLYPNPATDQVSISSESPLKQVTVVNLMGQVIKTLDQISGNTTMLDVKDLKSGVYYVVAVDQLGSKHSHSLIVE